MSAFVELGVGDGGFCKRLAKIACGNVWAYDTFDGKFPIQTVTDSEPIGSFVPGGLFSTQEVKKELEDLGVRCVEGLFPDTFHESHPEEVAFVHVDMDTYNSTKAALELFHPLMSADGVFMIHDYDNNGMPGVKLATAEFEAGPYGAFYNASDESGHRKLGKKSSQT